MGSTRLPRKVLLPLEDKTILEQVISRVQRSSLITALVVATTVNPEDDALADLCGRLNVEVYRGSEGDVLDRFYQAATLLQADHIVRVTADCPLIDPAVIDAVIGLHLQEQADYTTNTLQETFPDGQDVEVFTAAALHTAWQHARLTSEREHVTPYIRNHPKMFRLCNLTCPQNLGAKRWTVDNPEDYEFVKYIYQGLYRTKPQFTMMDVLAFLEDHGELEHISHHIARNEGYAKSLREDKLVADRGEGHV